MNSPAFYLTQIKEGKFLNFPAVLTKKRVFSISWETTGSKTYFLLSANNMKGKEALTEKACLQIISNIMEDKNPFVVSETKFDLSK